MGIWALETIYLASSVPCKVKALALLYGVIFTVLEYGFYLDFVAQNTIKKPASSPVTALIFTELKAMQTCRRYCTFVPAFFIDDSGAEFHAD